MGSVLHQMLPWGDRTEQHACDAINRRLVLPGFVIFPKCSLSAIDRRAGRGTGRAAVDEDFRALTVRRIVGSKEQHGLGNFVGLAEPPQRNGARQSLVQSREGFGIWSDPVPDPRARAAGGGTTSPRMRRGESSDAITRAIARTPALLAA